MLQLVHWYSFKVKSSPKQNPTNGRIIFPTRAHCINLVSFVGWCKFPHVFSKIFVLRSLHDSVGDADEVSKFDLLQAFQDDARSAAPRYQIFTFQKRVVEKAPAPVFRRFSLQLGDVKDVAMCSSHDMCLKILKKNVPVQIQKFVSLLNMKIRLGFWMDNRSTRKRGISHCQCFARFSPSPLFTPQKTSKIFDTSIVHGSQHLLKPQLPTTKKTTDNQSVIHLEGLLETIHGPLAFHCRSDFSNLSMKWKKCVRNVGDLFVVLIIFFVGWAWYRFLVCFRRLEEGKFEEITNLGRNHGPGTGQTSFKWF